MAIVYSTFLYVEERVYDKLHGVGHYAVNYHDEDLQDS